MKRSFIRRTSLTGYSPYTSWRDSLGLYTSISSKAYPTTQRILSYRRSGKTELQRIQREMEGLTSPDELLSTLERYTAENRLLREDREAVQVACRAFVRLAQSHGHML